MPRREVLGVTDRTIRRWKWQYELGYVLDRRWRHPSEKKIPVETVEKVLGLYREQYCDFSDDRWFDLLVKGRVQ